MPSQEGVHIQSLDFWRYLQEHGAVLLDQSGANVSKVLACTFASWKTGMELRSARLDISSREVAGITDSRFDES